MSEIKNYFEEVKGYEEVKQELLKVIEWFNKRKEFEKLGIGYIKGIMFHGDPGEGKTLFLRELSKAFDSKTYVFSPQTTNYVAEFKELIDSIKESKEDSGVIVIDELDKIISKSSEFQRYLLETMDGFEKLNTDLIFLATANKIIQMDRALFRPGRFEKCIYLSFKKEDIPELVDSYLTQLNVEHSNIDYEYIKLVFAGGSPVSIKRIIDKTYLRNNGVISEDLLDKEKDISHRNAEHDYVNEERDFDVCLHEAAHAVVLYRYKESFKIYKIVVSDSARDKGYVSYILDDKYNSLDIMTKDAESALAGYLINKVLHRPISKGCSEDLRKARQTCRAAINTGGYYGTRYILREYGSPDEVRNESQYQVTRNDKLANKLLRKLERNTLKYLKHNKDLVIKLANVLMEKGIIYSKEINALLGGNR